MAIESAFKAAGIKYAALLRDATFRKVGPEGIAAKRDYEMSKEALRVHRERHKKSEIVLAILGWIELTALGGCDLYRGG